MNEPTDKAGGLPRPFYASPWPRVLREDAQALWHWHTSLTRADAPSLDGADLTAFFEAEAQKAKASEPLRAVPEAVAQEAYRVCRAHALPLGLLAEQVLAARALQGEAWFATAPELLAFVDRWAGSHGLLLARLAGAGHSWQEKPIRELARAFFLTGRLVRLPEDLRAGKLFLPVSDLERAGVALEQLRAGRVDEHVRRLFWKQSVRIRDALAQGLPLMKELPRGYRSALKRYWVGALEVLNEVERRDYDLWSGPIRLSALRRFQVRLQAFFGKAASA